ncbi:hypothetical protein HAX54_045665 [Datura stramonium]|uniref:Uncharacterized protein n=1 Tax=Datura stramonium TaxID=4076 RepID=A0ABS8RPI4_DATST|nr:hypothetical protein [Datura stramonium]
MLFSFLQGGPLTQFAAIPHCTPDDAVDYIVTDLLDQGGLAEVEKKNKKKAEILYDAIDSSNGFYRIEAEFVKTATEKMVQLKGQVCWRNEGFNINVMPLAGVEKLVAYEDFQAKHG